MYQLNNYINLKIWLIILKKNEYNMKLHKISRIRKMNKWRIKYVSKFKI